MAIFLPLLTVENTFYNKCLIKIRLFYLFILPNNLNIFPEDKNM